MMRLCDVMPTAPPSTLKRPRPKDEGSTGNDTSKIPKVVGNNATQDVYLPHDVATPARDATHPLATPISVTESSMHIIEPLGTINGLYDDGQGFLDRLLSIGVGSEAYPSDMASMDPQNPLDISSGIWMETE